MRCDVISRGRGLRSDRGRPDDDTSHLTDLTLPGLKVRSGDRLTLTTTTNPGVGQHREEIRIKLNKNSGFAAAADPRYY